MIVHAERVCSVAGGRKQLERVLVRSVLLYVAHMVVRLTSC